MMKSLMMLLVAMVVGTSAVHQTPVPAPAPTPVVVVPATPTPATVASTSSTMHPQCIMVFPPLGMLPSLMRGQFNQNGLLRYVSVGAGASSQSMISVGIKAGTVSTPEYMYSVTTPTRRKLLVHQTPTPVPAPTPTPAVVAPTPEPVTITTMTSSGMLLGDWHAGNPMHGVRVSAHDCSFAGDIALATAALKAVGGGDLSGNKIRGVHPLGSFAVGNSTQYVRSVRAIARFSNFNNIDGTVSFTQTTTGATERMPAKMDINLFGLGGQAVNYYIATYHMGAPNAGCAGAGSLYNAPGHTITQFRRRNLLVHQTPVPPPPPTPTPTPTPVVTAAPTPTASVGGYATGNLSSKFGSLSGLAFVTRTGVTDKDGLIDVVDVIGRTIVITSTSGAALACAVLNEQ